MQPFFLYFGSKWKLAERLGPPQRDHVIEPFAGSAGYSVFWEPKKVTLIERDPVVCGVWKFLQRTSPTELMRLPSNISHVDELPSRVCQEARSLIGFWFNHGLEPHRPPLQLGEATPLCSILLERDGQVALSQTGRAHSPLGDH